MSLVASPALSTASARRVPSALAIHRCLMWVAIVGLCALAAVECALSAAMLVFPGELMYGEAILYDHARRVVEGVALYQPIDHLPYTVASYTPLYYWLAGATQWLFGDGLAPGRALALAALVAAAGLVGYLAASEGRGWRTGVLASLIFVALGGPGSGGIPWTALYKEDSLALALTLGSLCVVARAPRRSLAMAAAGLLAALAILTKQTYVPIVLAELVWVFWRDRRAGTVLTLAAVGPVLGVSALLEATTHAFVASTVVANINPFRLDWLRSNLVLLLLFQSGPIVAASIALLASRKRPSPLHGLMLLAWAGAAVLLLAIAKLGGASNHWLTFAAIAAILAAWAIVPAAHASRPAASQWMATAALAAGLLLLVPIASATWLTSLDTLRSGAESSSQFDQLVERVRAEDSTVLADPVDVVVLAGKHPLFEPLLLSIFAADGRWDVQPIVDQVCSGQIGLIVVDRPLSALDWPQPLRAAVEATMQLEGSSGGRLVYVPSDAACG